MGWMISIYEAKLALRKILVRLTSSLSNVNLSEMHILSFECISTCFNISKNIPQTQKTAGLSQHIFILTVLFIKYVKYNWFMSWFVFLWLYDAKMFETNWENGKSRNEFFSYITFCALPIIWFTGNHRIYTNWLW